ncbi:hypothetical protein MKJ05_00040 [Citrobacter braakii]|nr:hypothetical protein MKJ05_00040 [Citrobacter braakii]
MNRDEMHCDVVKI